MKEVYEPTQGSEKEDASGGRAGFWKLSLMQGGRKTEPCDLARTPASNCLVVCFTAGVRKT